VALGAGTEPNPPASSALENGPETESEVESEEDSE